MKEKIYTIPVNDAFDKDCECPFCELAAKLDAEITDYILGPSYMEEDIRAETDKAGFCKYHYDKLFHEQNRLGTALMVSTHLKKLRRDLEDILSSETEIGGKKGLFKKNTAASPLSEYTEKLSGSCYACQRAEGRMNSYIETFFYLWKSEDEFRAKVIGGKGFCLEHLTRIIAEAHKRMNDSDFAEFAKAIIPLQKENLARIDAELDWFIQKFDYRFKDEPWKNSKDSLERAILKISSVRMDTHK